MCRSLQGGEWERRVVGIEDDGHGDERERDGELLFVFTLLVHPRRRSQRDAALGPAQSKPGKSGKPGNPFDKTDSTQPLN